MASRLESVLDHNSQRQDTRDVRMLCLPFIGRVNVFKSGDINEDLMSGVDNDAPIVELTRRGEEIC